MSRRGVLLLLSLGIIWGIPYLLIKVAVTEVSPAMLVLARTAIASLLLVPLAAARGQLRPALRRWRPLLAFTIIEIVIPWYFLNRAEQHLPSSTTGLLIAAVPLVGFAIAFLTGRAERFVTSNWLGVALGMAGVATLVGFDLRVTDVTALLQLAVVIVCYAVGPQILSRWMHDLPGAGVSALSFAGAAIVYLPVVLVAGAWPTAMPSPAALGAMLVLGVVCSALAFLVFVALIAEVGPVRSTVVTYINPAVAVAAGALVLGESVTAWTVLGFVLVLAGSFLVTRRGMTTVISEPVSSPRS